MFELAAPWVLLLLPIPLICWYVLPKTTPQVAAALYVPFFDAMSHIADVENRGVIKQKKITLFLLIWALIVFSLAGPRWVGEPQPLAHEGYNIMLALDLSGSMELRDMALNGRPVSRLAVVKRAAVRFVQERTGDKIGLIVFGSQAYLQTPLTYDKQNILMRIDDATVGLAGKTTSIGDALGLAVKRLQAVPAKGRVIILLTDGVNNSGVLAPLKAAELARDDNIKVYTIGLGADAESGVMGNMFMNMTADLDEDTLQDVSKMTGGRYFRATDMQSLQSIYETINQLERVEQQQESMRPQKDYYAWPLAAALFLLLYWLVQTSSLGLAFYSAVIARKQVLE